jgi:hypothetical protein
MDYKDTAIAADEGDARPRRSKKFNKSSSTDAANKRIVEHNYHDHSRDEAVVMDADDESSKRRGPRGGVTVPFPAKLHLMLSKVEEDGLDHIVSWQPHGRCFHVHKPQDFVEQIMPKYFRQSKLTSFQRQLNLYGFSRITAGTDRGGYYHELFLRNKVFLCQNMNRIRIKGTGIKGKTSPATEPDFYSMPFMPSANSSDSEYHDLEEKLQKEEEKSRSKNGKESKSKSPRRRKSFSSSDKSKAAVEDVYSMSPPPLVSPDTPEKLPLKFQGDPNRWSSNHQRLSQYETFDDLYLNPPVMVQPQPGDNVTFEGQRFHYMDSFVPPVEAQPVAIKPRLSSSIVSLPLEQALHDPILTPSSSSSSLSELFRQEGSAWNNFNPATIFQEKDAEIIDEGRYLYA